MASIPDSAGVKVPIFAKWITSSRPKNYRLERKHFHVELRENDRGKFLCITEETHGRRNTIIVPTTGVEDLTAAIGAVLSTERMGA